MTEVDLDRVVEVLRTVYGVENAHVRQTGGGTATIYAGPTWEEPDWGTRYAVIAGPGWFEGPGFTRPRADTEELYVGPDDDGESRTWSAAGVADDPELVAALIALRLKRETQDGRVRTVSDLGDFIVADAHAATDTPDRALLRELVNEVNHVKLDLLAEWLDAFDRVRGIEDHEIQDDLRRWAELVRKTRRALGEE